MTPEEVAAAEAVQAIIDLEWQRCGQYGLQYFEAANGFYNCFQ